MTIEFQNPIARLSFLCRVKDIKIAWINPCINRLSNKLIIKKT